MDGLQICECSREMSGCSIHPNTKDEWIASMQDSLARILVSQEVRLALVKVRALDFTGKYSGLPMKFDLISSSWKMSQQSFLEITEECCEQSLETLPRVALMRSGVVYPLPKLALHTRETGGGSWAAPNTMDSLPPKSAEALNREMAVARPGRSKPANLRDQVSNMRLWPTPQSMDYRSGDNPEGVRAQRKREQGWSPNLNDIVRMYPTPAARDYKGGRKLETLEAVGRKLETLEAVGRKLETLEAVGRKLETLEAVGRKETNSLPDMVNHQHGATGRLNPRWVEWLMGWPIGHTSSKHWGTAKSRSKRQQPSQSSGE